MCVEAHSAHVVNSPGAAHHVRTIDLRLSSDARKKVGTRFSHSRPAIFVTPPMGRHE